MPLTEKQKEKLAVWLHEKYCRPECPSCGRNEWKMAEIIRAPLYDDESVASPMVQLICDNCAYIRLHSAEAIGLLEDGPESGPGV